MPKAKLGDFGKNPKFAPMEKGIENRLKSFTNGKWKLKRHISISSVLVSTYLYQELNLGKYLSLKTCQRGFGTLKRICK